MVRFNCQVPGGIWVKRKFGASVGKQFRLQACGALCAGLAIACALDALALTIHRSFRNGYPSEAARSSTGVTLSTGTSTLSAGEDGQKGTSTPVMKDKRKRSGSVITRVVTNVVVRKAGKTNRPRTKKPEIENPPGESAL